jgi:hypothetical protein
LFSGATPESEADHSPQSSAEVKNAWSRISIPQYTFMAQYSVKAQDIFTFTFTFLRHVVRKWDIVAVIIVINIALKF